MFGLIAYGVTFLIRFMPGMLELAMVIGGVTNGPIIGVFTAGLLIPWISARGALGGLISGVLLSSWIAGGAQVYRPQLSYTSVTSPSVPNSTDNCPDDWLIQNMTSSSIASSSSSEPLPGYLPLYELSYVWFSALGFWLTVVSALLLSIIWRQDVSRLDRRLLSPILDTVIQVGRYSFRLVYNCLLQGLPSLLKKKVRSYWESIGRNNLDLAPMPEKNGYMMAEKEIR